MTGLMIISDKDGTPKFKFARFPGYNYNFDYTTGQFARWGNTPEEDPTWSPIGPEILDIEVSTICHKGCIACYKGLTHIGKNMSIDTYKTILGKMGNQLTQVALGIGSLWSNPDLESILAYTRSKKIVPNITINGDYTDIKQLEMLAKYCGAVAVSLYDYDTCYNTIEVLTKKLGMKHVNIHCLVAEETFDKCMKVMEDSKTDPRLSELGSIVFLMLKKVGNRNNLNNISMDKYIEIVKTIEQKKIRAGFDSCSATLFSKVTKELGTYEKYAMFIEACESCKFSYYINTLGIGFPCSFTEQSGEYKGIDVVKCKSFMKDVWMGEETKHFRKRLDKCGRSCPMFKITGCEDK